MTHPMRERVERASWWRAHLEERCKMPDQEQRASRVTAAEIQEAVARYFALPIEEMKSARRKREVARPRQVAMYLCKMLTRQSLPEIGRRFGDRDHTTVMHAVRQIERLRRIDAEVDSDVTALFEALERAKP